MNIELHTILLSVTWTYVLMLYDVSCSKSLADNAYASPYLYISIWWQ